MNVTEDVIEITPSKKKLKQARLPFKTVTDSIITSDASPIRKRKLSTEHIEKESKIGKLNDTDTTFSELVVISDDESRDTGEREQENCKINPLVKLVDNVLRKKQKRKATKQNKKTKRKTLIDKSPLSAQLNKGVNNKHNDKNKVQAMEIDESDEIISVDKSEERTENTDKALSDETLTQNNLNSLRNDQCNNPNIEKNSNVMVITVDEIPKNSCNIEKQDNSVLIDNKLEVSETSKNVTATSVVKNSSDEVEKYIPSENNSEVKDCIEYDDNNSLSNFDKYSNNSCNIENQEKIETTVSTQNSNLKSLEVSNVPISPQKYELERNNNKNKMNCSSNSSKLDDSTSSNFSTPRRSKRNSDTSKDNLSDSLGPLTPKQLQRKQEFAKKKLEREQEKREREQKKQKEKEEKHRLKKEREELKKKEKEEKEEQRKKEKEEKEEQRKKEKEEKERQKELEKKLREEKEEKKRKEREEKEEQKRKEKEAKEEERRKKQEAMEQEKQEQELKKKKAAEVFANFFVPKQKNEKDQEHILASKNNMLSSFTKKADMRLAPIVRVQLDTNQQNELDKQMEMQHFIEKDLYLNSLKKGLIKPKSNGKTWPLDDKDNEEDDDVMIVEDELPPLDSASEVMSEPIIREKLRPKLLSFHENRRPPYWGTWRKKSNFIKPRRPFGQDEKQLDYEGDSDEEWEEEEGESIDGSVAGSDEDLNEADEYEVDNELFVPHGYLSDEEATMDEDDVLSLSPEAQKARLKHLEDEFELELKKPTEKLKTRLYGLLWENSDGGKPELCIESLWNYFSKMAMIVNDPTPLLQPSHNCDETEKKKVKKIKSQVEGEPTTPKTKKKKSKKLAENKETSEAEAKDIQSDVKKNQPGINAFLKKISTP